MAESITRHTAFLTATAGAILAGRMASAIKLKVPASSRDPFERRTTSKRGK